MYLTIFFVQQINTNKTLFSLCLEGRSLAKDRGCKFIETSVAINHQVDELLVGTLTQIRMKMKVADKLRKKRESQGCNRRSSIYNGSKASGVLKKILRRACLNSKSCDNLHVLWNVLCIKKGKQRERRTSRSIKRFFLPKEQQLFDCLFLI